MGTQQSQKNEMRIFLSTTSSATKAELFDFTKQAQRSKANKLLFPSYINCKGNQISYSLLKDSYNMFCRFDATYNEFNDVEIKIKKSHMFLEKKIWRLVGVGQYEEVKQGNSIKIGRVELQVKEITHLNKSQFLREPLAESLKASRSRQKLPHMNQSMMSRYSEHPMKASSYSYMSGQSQNVSCRICFEAYQNHRNPLLSICKCSGSVKHIHYHCFKDWVKSKTGRVQKSHCIYYSYQPLKCQICKHSIPNSIQHQGLQYYLLDEDFLHPPFARLSHTGQQKNLQIFIKLDEDYPITIGRNSENEIAINDNSISRNHCILVYKKKKLYLKNESPKYGTYLELVDKYQSYRDQQLNLLIGNQLLSFQRDEQEGSSLLGSGKCCTEDMGRMYSIQLQNDKVRN